MSSSIYIHFGLHPLFNRSAGVYVGWAQWDLVLGAVMGRTVRNLCRQLLLGSLGAERQESSSKTPSCCFFSHPRLESSAADWKTLRPLKLLRSHFPLCCKFNQNSNS